MRISARWPIALGFALATSVAVAPSIAAADSGSPPVQAPPSVPVEVSEPVVANPTTAKQWLALGQQFVREADALARRNQLEDAKLSYENAVTAFRTALAAGADAATSFELAGVHEKLGRFDDAIAQYRTVARATDPPRTDLIAKATGKLKQLAIKVGFVTFAVTPDGATISFGDRELGRTPMTDPIPLVPGNYRLWIAADGFTPKAVDMNIEPGMEAEWKITLEPVKVVIEAPPLMTGEHAVRRRSMLPLYVGGGVALAATGAAMITGILAVSEHRTYVAPESSSVARADARSRGKRLALASDLSLATALIAGAATAYWYFALGRDVAPEQQDGGAAPKVSVVPWVSPDAGGVAMTGEL